MIGIVAKPDTRDKLEILSSDAQYDLACACGTNREEGRRRGQDGRWIYPVTLPNGGRSVLFKSLISNVCTNDCKYCPLREQQDIRRCSLSPEETARVFLDYYRRKKVFGLFLSSGVIGSPDATMDRLTTTARLLRRRHGFKGYIHLKVIPGSSAAAIEEAVSLASAVSLNIETPGHKHLARLSSRKNYIRDIIEPIKLISRLTARGTRFARVKQTTQFIVGAAGESDAEIVKYMGGLYDRLRMQRIYFSAYQRGVGDASLDSDPTKSSDPTQAFVREHRLYQVDFLLRKYGFKDADIVFDPRGRLSLDADPKEVWARNHPEVFPLDVNRASRLELLRVPGLGPLTVDRIVSQRATRRIRGLEDIGRVGARLAKARSYLMF
ncbi:MAG: radical SAM protein [Sedimentisphaerales bacterium]|jgi:predicted DNA-binding helix-hairpin-helix protein|nr:radical SAM protein [Sedimentisphaerales bacterium]HNY76897.1 radical SAM protein [Sedimentisphaerales bacterium]HOC62751.1 radical SAM protein [Sedimentisphaerales bacterium]HOH62671.1 radical SAM protein [Sedimentisphaerales bacterium]HPY49524.1 radical SAM protein [Sedimentisphaerales bacterium]